MSPGVPSGCGTRRAEDGGRRSRPGRPATYPSAGSTIASTATAAKSNVRYEIEYR